MKFSFVMFFLFLFNYQAFSNELDDGLYFSIFYDSNDVKWEIEVEKLDGNLIVHAMYVGPVLIEHSPIYFIDIPNMLDLSERISPTSIVNDDFNFSRIKFAKSGNAQTYISFYGNLQTFSNLRYQVYSNETSSGKVVFIDYKYYDHFLDLYEMDDSFTTEKYKLLFM